MPRLSALANAATALEAQSIVTPPEKHLRSAPHAHRHHFDLYEYGEPTVHAVIRGDRHVSRDGACRQRWRQVSRLPSNCISDDPVVLLVVKAAEPHDNDVVRSVVAQRDRLLMNARAIDLNP